MLFSLRSYAILLCHKLYRRDLGVKIMIIRGHIKRDDEAH
jgi:hypothetical protein